MAEKKIDIFHPIISCVTLSWASFLEEMRYLPDKVYSKFLKYLRFTNSISRKAGRICLGSSFIPRCSKTVFTKNQTKAIGHKELPR